MPQLAPYLFELLYNKGAKHAFGIPGDFALTLYDALSKSPIRHVGVTHEPCAGFAADVYARINGIGLAVITYSVGGINLANAIACAYAEKSPVVIISGGPGVKERKERLALHHKVKSYNTQLNIFKEITAYAAILDNPQTAPMIIQEALTTCLLQKRPVYLEIPRDQIYSDIAPIKDWEVQSDFDENSLHEAIEESLALLTHATKPVVWVDIEVLRFNLQKEVVCIAEKLNAPVFCTLLGRSAFLEGHPNFKGVYSGQVGNQKAHQAIQSSDGLLIIGMIPSDINLGLYTSSWNPKYCINASFDSTFIRHHQYPKIDFSSYIKKLSQLQFGKKEDYFEQMNSPIDSITSNPIDSLMSTVISNIGHHINEDTILIGDAGDSLFAMADIANFKNATIIHPSFYSSMGFSIPGALGALCAMPNKKALVLIGDGAFQMTGLELCSIKNTGLDCLVIVLNNGAYASLAQMGHQDSPFTQIASIHYANLAQSMGIPSQQVHTIEQFSRAFIENFSQSGCRLLEVNLDKKDVSPMLKKIGLLFANTLKG